MSALDTSRTFFLPMQRAVNAHEDRDTFVHMADMIEGIRRTRDRTVPVPEWWFSQALAHIGQWQDARRARGDKWDLGQLGAELAMKVGRVEPWTHGTVSRFMRRERITDGLVRAISVYFDIPMPVYHPRNLREATAFKAAAETQASGEGRVRVVDDDGPPDYIEKVRELENEQSAGARQPAVVPRKNARGIAKNSGSDRGPPRRMGTRRKRAR